MALAGDYMVVGGVLCGDGGDDGVGDSGGD